MTESADVAPEVLTRLRSICLGLPDVREEQAWVGTRWRVRTRTFAHVLAIDAKWPPAYARAAEATGPMTVMTFRSSAPELDGLRCSGHPFFAPPWGSDVVGTVLDAQVDWAEIAELLTESYCVLAPKSLAKQVIRPAG